MNIAKPVNETTNNQETGNLTFYVNMNFELLAQDIKNSPAAFVSLSNLDILVHQLNGKGRQIALIPEQLESKYFDYSSDPAGINKLTPPLNITNGNTVTCILQPYPENNSLVEYSWEGIVQTAFNLQRVSNDIANAEVVYLAVMTQETAETEDDDVIITINFTIDGKDFSAAWDPRVKIKRG